MIDGKVFIIATDILKGSIQGIATLLAFALDIKVIGRI